MSDDRGGAPSSQARNRLICAAEDFIDRGEVANTTVGSLADAAGVHRVTFYRHFPDKESLLAEVLVLRTAPVLEEAARTLAEGGFFPHGLIETMATAVEETRARPGLLAALGVFPTSDEPRPAGTSARFLQRAVDITAPHVSAAQEAGVLRGDLTAAEIVEWLLEVCLSALLLRPDDSPHELRRHLHRFVVPAIGAHDS